jgi:hypothetical protein
MGLDGWATVLPTSWEPTGLSNEESSGRTLRFWLSWLSSWLSSFLSSPSPVDLEGGSKLVDTPLGEAASSSLLRRTGPSRMEMRVMSLTRSEPLTVTKTDRTLPSGEGKVSLMIA